MEEEHYTLLDVIAQQLHTDQNLYSALRFLPGHTRHDVLVRHMRSNASVHAILALYLRQTHNSNVSFTIPITLPANWDEPVVVAPSAQQVADATEAYSGENTMCTICQENVAEGTRLRSCRHCFHSACIEEWFAQSVFCPVCRHDVREGSERPSHQRPLPSTLFPPGPPPPPGPSVF
jgi:hypothetical protein